MTNYTLTNQADNFPGSTGTDIFSGPGGGKDALFGNAGADAFIIQSMQTGRLDGGADVDKIYMRGAANKTLDKDLVIVGIEQLIVQSISLTASVGQINTIARLVADNNSDDFTINLRYTGGSINFARSWQGPQKLEVNAELATSAVTINGSNFADTIFGSDFADRLTGAGGNDTIYGGAGGDLVNGGLGKDKLYGDAGNDSYFFNTELAATNVDSIGDFRGEEDTIRLARTIFGEFPTGTLSSDLFKDLGLAAQDGDDRILYNSLKGALYYDGDGLGGTKPVLFALLDNFAGDVPTVTAADIFVA